jgi:hypothetical protein
LPVEGFCCEKYFPDASENPGRAHMGNNDPPHAGHIEARHRGKAVAGYPRAARNALDPLLAGGDTSRTCES